MMPSTITCGDVNFEHVYWSPKGKNAFWIDFLMKTIGMRSVCGPESLPTFKRGDMESWIDVILYTTESNGEQSETSRHKHQRSFIIGMPSYY